MLGTKSGHLLHEEYGSIDEPIRLFQGAVITPHNLELVADVRMRRAEHPGPLGVLSLDSLPAQQLFCSTGGTQRARSAHFHIHIQRSVLHVCFFNSII